MDAIVNFGKFWYEFVVGDDWMIAVVVAVVLAILAVAHSGALWPVLPVVVIAILGISLARATR